jgi:hypothetical protein
MLYKFKSKVTGDLIMLEPNGRQTFAPDLPAHLAASQRGELWHTWPLANAESFAIARS